MQQPFHKLTRNPTNVYAFGSGMGYTKTGGTQSGRVFSYEKYRYGFNDKEKLTEGTADNYDFGARVYDGRLGRFLSLDPLWYKAPGWSPYCFASDNPIMLVDLNGLTTGNPQKEFHDQFESPAMKAVTAIGATNKYKALYIIAHRRAENSYNLAVPNNNPMNIMGEGDLGHAPEQTTEWRNGKIVYVTENFANYSTVQKGFEGYIKLIKSNDKDAYDAIKDDSKTFDDFTKGLTKGGYSTTPTYAAFLKTLFNEEVSYYKKDITDKIAANTKQIDVYNAQLKSCVITKEYAKQLPSLISALDKSNVALKKDLEDVKKLK